MPAWRGSRNSCSPRCEAWLPLRPRARPTEQPRGAHPVELLVVERAAATLVPLVEELIDVLLGDIEAEGRHRLVELLARDLAVAVLVSTCTSCACARALVARLRRAAAGYTQSADLSAAKSTVADIKREKMAACVRPESVAEAKKAIVTGVKEALKLAHPDKIGTIGEAVSKHLNVIGSEAKKL